MRQGSIRALARMPQLLRRTAPGEAKPSSTNFPGVQYPKIEADGRVTFLTVECLCACEQAPMMQVDDRYEGLLTSGKVDQILGTLR